MGRLVMEFLGVPSVRHGDRVLRFPTRKVLLPLPWSISLLAVRCSTETSSSICFGLTVMQMPAAQPCGRPWPGSGL